MNLANIRLGFATNSSSSHSIVFRPIYESDWTDEVTGNGFGWEDFCLRSRSRKRDYIIAAVASNLSNTIPYSTPNREQQINAVLVDIFGPGDYDYTEDEFDNYIDHQSCPSIPYKFGTKELDRRFIDELQHFLVDNDNLAVCGGNDNSDPYDYGGTEVPAWDKIRDRGRLVGRKDGPWWTLFNPQYGGKIRFSLTAQGDYLWAPTPELVDIKLTNFCQYGCHFCAIPGTQILLDSGGTTNIENFVDYGDWIRTANPEEGTLQNEWVCEIHKREYAGDVIEIELESGRFLTLTPDHEVYTLNRGWITAGELLETDELAEPKDVQKETT